jgi:beta-lactamase class C
LKRLKQIQENKTQSLIFAFLIIAVIAFTVSAHQNNRVQLPEITKDSLANSVSAREEIKPVLADYDSTLTFELKNAANVGAAVAVVYKNEIVYLKCFGVRQKGSKDSVDEHTVFRLASVSKTVSGVLAGLLFTDSILMPEQKIVELLPGFRLLNQEQANQLTLNHILSHTSGMPQHTYDDLVEQKVPQKAIIAKLAEVGHASKPGELYAYQNVMYSLFDTIVAARTGKSYPEVLDERIFTPFGMKDASASFNDFANNPDKAMPHTSGRSGFRMIPLNDRYYNTLAAAGVNASISDMAHFVLKLLNDTVPQIQKAKEIIFAPQIRTRLTSGYFSQWENVNYKAYGMGWRIIDYKSRRLAYHGGFLKGYRAEIAVCPDENVGIVFLSNSPNSSAAKAVPLFLNRFFREKDFQKMASDTISDSNPLNKI